MYRIIAAVVLVIGILTVGLSSVSYFHLQQLAYSARPTDFIDQIALRVITVGMRYDAGSNVVDAADFARQLQTRIFIVFGIGMLLLLSGGALVLQSRREQGDGRDSAGNVVPSV